MIFQIVRNIINEYFRKQKKINLSYDIPVIETNPNVFEDEDIYITINTKKNFRLCWFYY